MIPPVALLCAVACLCAAVLLFDRSEWTAVALCMAGAGLLVLGVIPGPA